jgi:NitT/TauT family transport system ATP-binding protein
MYARPLESQGVPGTALHALDAPPHVSIRDVALNYKHGGTQTRAVEGLTLDVRRGEFIAVVGPSGCGKSTLMKLVTGLLMPDAGEVVVHGKRTAGPVKGVGMAFQNSTLMPWRTTLENVMLPLEIVQPYKGRMRAERRQLVERAEAILHSVGLADFASKYPFQLSGGMQQRASLCRALIHEPELLMLDEPFGALDAMTKEDLWAIMQQLWLDRKFTAIMVTHDLREAVFLADTVYVLSARPGRVVMRREIDLPRPRSLDDSFAPEFVELVHQIRGYCLGNGRSESEC